MIINDVEIAKMEKLARVSLVNKLCGPRSANLIATANAKGETNLTIFNSVMHIGANPPLMGFLMRPLNVERHTFQNIMETGLFTINQVSESMFERAHQTSAKYPKDVSEFESCDFEPEYHPDFAIPFVAESKVKIALRFIEKQEINANKTILVIGQIEKIILEEAKEYSLETINFEELSSIALGGLDTYYKCEQIQTLKYARP